MKKAVAGLTPSEPDDGAARVDGRAARWTGHRVARRAELIEATIAAIDEFGADVGVEQIAATARTSKPVIYRYFTDKDELYRAVGARLVGDIAQTLVHVSSDDSPDPRNLIRSSIDAYLQLLEDHPQRFRFLAQHRVFHETRDGRTRAAEAGGAAVAQVLTAAFAAHLQAIGIDPAAASPWGEAVVGFIRAASVWWLDHPDAMSRRQLTDYLSALLWGGGAGVYQFAGQRVDSRPADGIFPRLS